MSEEQLQLLIQAKQRAQRLVGQLRSQSAEVEANSEGGSAMQNAIAAAQRTVASLESAISTKQSD
jgi:hypothetical protein